MQWLVHIYRAYLDAYKDNSNTNVKYNLMCKLVDMLLSADVKQVPCKQLECIAGFMQVYFLLNWVGLIFFEKGVPSDYTPFTLDCPSANPDLCSIRTNIFVPSATTPT